MNTHCDPNPDARTAVGLTSGWSTPQCDTNVFRSGRAHDRLVHRSEYSHPTTGTRSVIQISEAYLLATGKSLPLAYFEARDAFANEVGGQHLLVGLAANTACGASALLAHLGLADTELRRHLSKQPTPAGPLGHLPTGQAVADAFERTTVESHGRSRPSSTIDLLVSIIDDPNHSEARELVQRCGVEPEVVIAAAKRPPWQGMI